MKGKGTFFHKIIVCDHMLLCNDMLPPHNPLYHFSYGKSGIFEVGMSLVSQGYFAMPFSFQPHLAGFILDSIVNSRLSEQLRPNRFENRSDKQKYWISKWVL